MGSANDNENNAPEFFRRSLDAGAVLSFYGRELAGIDDSGELVDAMARAHGLLADCFSRGGKLLVAGCGGSFADAQHIVGELTKAFERARPLPVDEAERLRREPYGELLAEQLDDALPAVALGGNVALASAVMNDKAAEPRLAFAQELWALGRPGDVFWGISTSGGSVPVLMALSAARARGMKTLGMSASPGGELARRVDIALRAPSRATAAAQETHIRLYHALCRGLEEDLFSNREA